MNADERGEKPQGDSNPDPTGESPQTDADSSAGQLAPPPAIPASEAPDRTNTPLQGNKNPTIQLIWEVRLVELLALVVNVGLAIVGIVALCIYSGQLKVMEGQLDATRASIYQTRIILRESQIQAIAARNSAETAAAALKSSVTSFRQQARPYIVNETTRINATPTTGLIVGIESVVRNTGTTPALQMRLKQNFDFQSKLPCVFNPTTKISGSDPAIEVGAGLQRSVRVFGERALNAKEADDIEKGRSFICYSAIFQYKDIFRDDHTTESCGYYRPPRPGTVSGQADLFLYACPSHNKVE